MNINNYIYNKKKTRNRISCCRKTNMFNNKISSISTKKNNINNNKYSKSLMLKENNHAKRQVCKIKLKIKKIKNKM